MGRVARRLLTASVLAAGVLTAGAASGALGDMTDRQLEWPEIEFAQLQDFSQLAGFEDLEPIDLEGIALEDLGLPEIDFEDTGITSSLRQMTRGIYRLLPPPPAREITVVLDRDGHTLYPGPDHAWMGTSSLLLSRGIQRMDIPAYEVGERRWSALKQCVESRFDGFAVNVTDQAPPTGDYITVHLGGDPSLLQREASTRGLAPLTGRPIRNAPVFVFTHGTPSVTELCDASAHEVGHALGLDHSRLCSDLMSYENCGPRRFRDEPAKCGEYEDRECESGHDHQSSGELLEQHVGRRHSHQKVS